VQLYLFERSGKFVRKIGQEGKGPEEYTILFDVSFSPNEDFIIVYDSQKKVFFEYSFSGELLRSTSYEGDCDGLITSLKFIDDWKSLAKVKQPIYRAKDFSRVRLLDREYQTSRELLPVSTRNSASTMLVTSGADSYYKKDGTVYFRESYFNTLYSFEDGDFIPRYQFIIDKNAPGYYYSLAKHPKDNFNAITGIMDIGEYFIIGIRDKNGQRYNHLYNKTSGEKFKLSSLEVYVKKSKSQMGAPIKKTGQEEGPYQIKEGIYNDIDGFYNIGIRTFPRTPEKYIINDLEIIDLKEYVENERHLKNKINSPAKQQELVELVKNSSENDNPILQIFHLKK